MPARKDHALSTQFEALYHEQFPFVWRTLRRFGIPDSGLDDATQDVFVVVHRRFGAWETGGSLRAWLYGVARRVAAAHRRRVGRHQRKLAALPEPRGSILLDERLGARHELERFGREIDKLEPARRQVYVLIEFEGLSAPEVAEALGCKINTVYSRLRRARAELDQALGPGAAGGRRRKHDQTG